MLFRRYLSPSAFRPLFCNCVCRRRPERPMRCQPRAAPWVKGSKGTAPCKGKIFISWRFKGAALTGRCLIVVIPNPGRCPWADRFCPVGAFSG